MSREGLSFSPTPPHRRLENKRHRTTNKNKHLTRSVREKAFSPVLAPTADVPYPFDEPPAAASAGGPAPTRVSPYTIIPNQDQISAPAYFPAYDTEQSNTVDASTTFQRALGEKKGRRASSTKPEPRSNLNNEIRKANDSDEPSSSSVTTGSFTRSGRLYNPSSCRTTSATTLPLQSPMAGSWLTDSYGACQINPEISSPAVLAQNPLMSPGERSVSSTQPHNRPTDQRHSITSNNKYVTRSAREKALSPAPAPSVDVPYPVDEPPAAAGAGGPAPIRVSHPTINPNQDQLSSPTYFSANETEQSNSLRPPGRGFPVNSTQPHRSPEDKRYSRASPVVSEIHIPPSPTNTANRRRYSGLSTSPPDEKDSTLAIQWNTNGLRANLGELQIIIARNSPICLAIQETHTNSDIDLATWFGNRYQWETARGSNLYQTIGLGIRTDIPSEPIPLTTELIATASRITYPLNCTVANVYLPHTISDFGNKFRNLVRQLPIPFIIMGDFNAHHTSWGSEKCCHRGNVILEVAEDTNTIILNDGSTTFLRGRTSSAIDLTICSSNLAGSLGWRVSPDMGNSDHFPIVISHKYLSPATTRRRQWIFDRADWPVFEEEISESLDHDRNYATDELTNIILRAAGKSIPRTSGTPPPKAVHWWNPEVAAILKDRRTALRALKRTPRDLPIWEKRSSEYRRLRNKGKKAVEEAKAASWTKFIDGISPNSPTPELWRRVNALSGKRRQIGFTLTTDGGTTMDPQAISNQIGTHFQLLSADESLPPAFLRRKAALEASPTSFSPDSSQEYNRAFSNIELATALGCGRGKSTGLDDIGYPMLRHLPPIGKSALLRSFNTIWEGGSFPDNWREALIVPIPKKKRPRIASDFRPISLLPCTSKVMERMVNRRLTTLLEDRNLLDLRQFAFRKGLGAGVHLGSFGEVATQAMNEGHHIDIAILDLAKAYNTTWREGILRQLRQWGIEGNLGLFVQHFLSNRRFQVGIGGSRSNFFQEANGVPQGSVLAVTLFLIGMNSLFATLPKGVFIFVYADDIILVVTGKHKTRVRIKLQAAVRAVGIWAESVGFNIAAEKCAVTHCCNTMHRATDRPVKLLGTIIPFKKEPKILGITIDRKLTFLPHFRNVKQDCKSRKRLIQVISTRHTKCNRTTLLDISRVLIQSKIYYGLELTCCNWEDMVKTLSPLYHGAIRFASNLLPSTPAEAACMEAGILPFKWATAVATLRQALRFLEKTTGTDCALLRTAEEIHSSFTNSPLPQIARLYNTGNRAWSEHGPNTDTNLTRRLKAGVSPNIARASFLQHVNRRYSNHLKIFTDGSKLNGRVGVGVSGVGAGLSTRLPSPCSVFSAEAAAIALAITKKPEDVPVVIFSDSLSVITALSSGNSRHPFVQAIEQSCDSLTSICWVPGHSGIHGNEDADRLACLGRQSSTLLTKKVPAADILNEFKGKAEANFTSHWRSSQGHLQKVKCTLEGWTDRDSRLEQRALSRLRVGHTKITHAHTISRVDPPICESCQTRLTVEHLLINCQELIDLRQQYNLPLSIRDVLDNDPVREETLLAFLKDARIFDAI
ncbi:uncharacterized protein LOC131694718 [Topomyia yanbarensis]|uniref:uncharacterized protein LOC131694718 n=1 Tax=Topomyia yanbarensis TaxID=2498891 RepID=UPI00273B3C79|nr:uncharacterized protein LOC131694718 [Topomyia yanbarensis]